MCSNEYTKARHLAVSCLTLFNAHRGGEPVRLLLKTVLGFAIVWSVEQWLFGHFKVTFQAGKGYNHLVLVWIPDDAAEAVRQLADPGRRKERGVQEEKLYLFSCVQGSHDHVS